MLGCDPLFLAREFRVSAKRFSNASPIRPGVFILLLVGLLLVLLIHQTMSIQDEDSLECDELSESLRNCLDSIETDGISSNAKGVFDDVNPGLEIDGLGGIGMPVSQHDALRVIEQSPSTPFGEGSETLVDTSVRTWEVDAARIRCMHPKWPAFQQAVLESACKQLGVPGGVQVLKAEMHELLVYEEGALFKSHKDTEKTPGMFGTLVVSLPSSEHEGGDIPVSFNGSNEILQTSVHSRWSSSYVA